MINKKEITELTKVGFNLCVLIPGIFKTFVKEIWTVLFSPSKLTLIMCRQTTDVVTKDIIIFKVLIVR